jgi:undecaprenyl-diphosphatase
MRHTQPFSFLLSLPRLVLQQEGIVLVAVFVVVVSLWGFVELADEVLEGNTQAFDLWVMQQLRHSDDLIRPIGPAWLIEAGQEITALGGISVLAIVVLAVVGYLFRQRTFAAMWLVLIATLGGTLLSFMLKFFFGRERPDATFHLVTVHSPSFPSGHAMLSAVVYLTLGALLAQVVSSRADKMYFIIVAFVLTLLIGLSRVYLGVHYPTDVLAGWSVGLAWALLCWVVARYLRRRGMVDAVQENA